MIDTAFPFTRNPDAESPIFDATYADRLAAVVDVAASVPGELLTLSSKHLVAYTGSLAQLRMALRMFEAGYPDWKVKGVHLSLLRNLLTLCPDDVPAASVQHLQFIETADLRDELRHDISRASNALVASDWKSATVLGGAAAEALLRWAIDQRPADAAAAAAALYEDKTFSKKAASDLNEWTLHHYIEVAGHLKLVSEDTVIQVRLAKNFRNLIHPGRAIRLSRTCDRGTALAALAAVEMVVADLSRLSAGA